MTSTDRPDAPCLLLAACLALWAGACSSDDTTAAQGAGASTGTTSGTGGWGSGGETSTSTQTTSTQTTTGAGGAGGGAAKNVVRFAALGDQGKGNQGQLDVAAAIAAKCAQDGCDFVQLLGDNIYETGVDSTADAQWQSKFEVPYAAIDLPFWAVLGNHDYGGNGTGNEFGKGQNEVDYTQVSTKWKMPAAYYQHTEKHVDFFALDTNMAMYSQADGQKSDVPGWIAASTADWKIALGHHPYLSNGPHGNAGEYDGLPFVPVVNGAGVKDLLDTVVCGKVDVYLSGHDHSVQWLVPSCGGSTELIVSGAGAATTELPGSNATYYQSLDLGFLYVRIEDNVFTGEFIDVGGNVVYTRTVTK